MFFKKKLKNNIVSIGVSAILSLGMTQNSQAVESGGISISPQQVHQVQSSDFMLKGAIRLAWSKGEIRKNDTIFYLKKGQDLFSFHGEILLFQTSNEARDFVSNQRLKGISIFSVEVSDYIKEMNFN